MNPELFIENSISAAFNTLPFNTLPNTIIYLKVVKYLNIRLRQICETNLELTMRKIENRMLYYGCKGWELLCLKFKALWWCLFLFFNPSHATDQRFSDVFRGYQKRSVAWNGLIHNGLCGRSADFNYFHTESIPCTNFCVRVTPFACRLRARS